MKCFLKNKLTFAFWQISEGPLLLWPGILCQLLWGGPVANPGSGLAFCLFKLAFSPMGCLVGSKKCLVGWESYGAWVLIQALHWLYDFWISESTSYLLLETFFSSGSLRWPWGVGWGEGREAQEGGDIYIIITDLHCCRVETNRT